MPNNRLLCARSAASGPPEGAMPLPAVIQFTSPGTIDNCVPRLSRCRIEPSNRYVTVASPICGCGRTSTPFPGQNPAPPHVLKKEDRPYPFLPLCRGAPPHLEAADVVGPRQNLHFDA